MQKGNAEEELKHVFDDFNKYHENFAEEVSVLKSDIFSNKPHVMKCYMTPVVIMKYSH
jgi:hypothetical protein